MATVKTFAGGLPGGIKATTPDWPTVTAVVDSFFTLFDGDKNGNIAFSEIAAKLDPGGHHTELNSLVQQLLGQIDSNADQSLSRTELNTAIGKLDTNADGVLSPADLGRALAQAGSAPMLALILNGMPLPGGNPVEPHPHSPPSVTEVVDELFARFDADKDKSLTLAELTAVLDAQHKHQRLDDALAALVKLVDKNGDSKMSYAEVTAAVSTLDADGNGTIDHRDHLPGPPADDSVDLVGQLMPHVREADGGFNGH